jgi:uncharacterized protein
VHVSQLSHRFMKDPNDAVKVGEIVKVKVLSADAERKRISLSIKQAEPEKAQKGAAVQRKPAPKEVVPEKASWEKAGFRIKK